MICYTEKLILYDFVTSVLSHAARPELTYRAYFNNDRIDKKFTGAE